MACDEQVGSDARSWRRSGRAADRVAGGICRRGSERGRLRAEQGGGGRGRGPRRKAAAEPLTVLPFSLHRLYADTGDRNTYEALYFDRRKALADLEISILANRDGDGALSTALNDLLWAICDEYTWALPAHLGLLQRPEQITLDLFACETGLYIAEALHLLYDRIDARVAERCRAELRRRILDSFLAEYPAEWWESGTNNWGRCAPAP